MIFRFLRNSISENKTNDPKQKIIDDLNETLKQLRNQTGELEVNLKLVKFLLRKWKKNSFF